MNKVYQVYQVSDSTGETLDRIFLSLKAQFSEFNCKTVHYSFTRTENQIDKVISKCNTEENVIILYTIVDKKISKYLAEQCKKNNVPCFEVLGNLISDFSKLLNKKASNIPSGQHVLDEEYYKRIEAVQFTMSHDDGKIISDLDKSDVILLGISRTSKTPTSIYLANKGFKTSNIPLINEHSIPKALKENPQMACVIGLNTEAERLVDIRKNRMNSLKETENKSYTDLENIRKEVMNAKKTFQKYKWPSIDVTRKSVEEVAASIIKIHEIYKQND